MRFLFQAQCIVTMILMATVLFGQSTNDNCANRKVLTDGVTQFFDTTLDTHEGPSPECGGVMDPVDIWYSYTATCDGLALVSVCGSSFDTRLAAFSEANCPVSTQIACNDDSCGLQSEMEVPVLLGDEIIIQVCGYESDSVGSGSISVTCISEPSNNDCSSPTPIVDGLTPIDIRLATTDGLGVNSDVCSSGEFYWSTLHNDIWFEYVATADSTKTISTCGLIDFESRIAVWESATVSCPVGSGTEQALSCNFHFNSCSAGSELELEVTAGSSYLIQVGSSLSNRRGSGELFIRDYVEPVSAATCTLTDPALGSASIAWTNGALYSDVSVYIDDHLVATLAGTETNFNYNFAQGGNYQVCIEGDDTGLVCCELLFDIVPANDTCLTPEIVFDGLTPFNTYTATTSGVSVDPGSCGGCPVEPAISKDVWFEYTPMSDGPKTFSICNTDNFAGTIVVWNAANFMCSAQPQQSSPIACECAYANCSDSSSGIQLNVTAGETYYIQLGALWSNQAGRGVLLIEDYTYPVSDVTCTLTNAAAGDVSIRWLENDSYNAIKLYKNDMLVATLPPGLQSHVIPGLHGGSYAEYCVEADNTGRVCCVSSVPVPPIENMDCDVSIADQIMATWTNPLAYDWHNVYVDGVYVMELPGNATSHIHDIAPGAVGVVSVAIESGIAIARSESAHAICEGAVGGPINNECAFAVPVGYGDTAFDTSITTDSLEGFSCGQGGSSLWFEHTAVLDGDLVFSLCDSSYPTILSVFDACGGSEIACDVNSCGDQSEITIQALVGERFLIQVGGVDGTRGTGNLNVSGPCGILESMSCDYDCSSGLLNFSWQHNPHASNGYEIFENGMLIATLAAGTASYTHLNPVNGSNTYEILWTCNLGGPVLNHECQVNVPLPIAIGVTDVVLGLEGFQSAGNFGDIDSATAIEAALQANNLTVARLGAYELLHLGTSSCYDFSAVSRLWVAAGTFPNNYSLSQAEGSILASLAASGINIYYESGDHWGFDHIDSQLDSRDGVQPYDLLHSFDGDDTFTEMDGQFAERLGLDLSGYENVAYGQDSILMSDDTDVLIPSEGIPRATQHEVVISEALWRNSDDGFPDPTDPEEAWPYITSLVAVHADGGVMLSQSWEFGGFALDHADPAASNAARNALMAEYISALSYVTPSEVFVRGDCNDNGQIDVADVTYLLAYLFPNSSVTAAPVCLDACDANDDGLINIVDVPSLISSLYFSPSSALPEPFPNCGLDFTGQSNCADFVSCP